MEARISPKTLSDILAWALAVYEVDRAAATVGSLRKTGAYHADVDAALAKAADALRILQQQLEAHVPDSLRD